MLQNIEVQVCGLIPMLIICFFSFRRESVILKSTWIYRQLLLVTTVCISADIFSVICIHLAPAKIAVIACKFYLWLTIWTAYLSFNYLCYDISTLRRRQKLRNGFALGIAALASVMMCLPVRIYKQHGAVYSYGAAVNFTFGLCALFIFGCIFLTFVYKKQINPHRCMAIQIWMLLESLGAAMQFNDRRLLFVSYTMMIGMVILYAKLENPDARLDRETGAYNFRMLRDYVKELYENNQRCAFVIAAENETREKDPVLNEKIMLELSHFLGGVSAKRLFRGYGNDFLMIFPTADEAYAALPAITERLRSPFAKNIIITPDLYIIPDTGVTKSAAEMLALYNYYSYNPVSTDKDYIEIGVEELDRMNEYRRTQLEIISALNDNRVEVFLQPIYSVKQKKFVSAEALVRIRRKNGELVMPNAFIPIAEQSGLIEQLGDRVFEKVCGYIRDDGLEKLGVDYIEVNLSIVQCENNALAERYAELIKSYGISPNAINLEITETGQMHQKHTLMRNMDDLRKTGCTFSLDDFGTGESNLNYIVEMPVDIVKFDRSMIQSYFSNQRTRHMMEYVISMIKSMGMKIVAEGVETKDQLAVLERAGIDYIQGYCFSKPLPKDEFISFVKKHNNIKK